MFGPPREMQPITVDTLAAISRQFLDGPLRPDDLEAVATLLNGLEADMAAFHRLQLGELEPLLVYMPEKEI
jgi:hypothetical protein